MLLVGTATLAAPHRPASDDVVLEHLPGGEGAARLASLRRAANEGTGDAGRARALARGYLDLGRRQGEPRLVAYAATVIAPFTEGPSADPEDLVLAATAAQYLHDFDGALALLDRALQRQPLHAQAWLTRADLEEVRGEFASARASCARTAQAGAPLVAIACLTSIDSRTGHLEESYRRLREAYAASPGLPADIDAWILLILADMADRSGDGEAQRRYLKRAGERLPDDLKVFVADADRALAAGQPQEVLAAAPADGLSDTVLLRLAIAARQTGDRRSAGWAAEFRERQRLASGDARHLREWARFQLDVEDDPAAAVRFARENWQRQREPEDLRLLWRAALAANDAPAREEARRWIREHGYQDFVLR